MRWQAAASLEANSLPQSIPDVLLRLHFMYDRLSFVITFCEVFQRMKTTTITTTPGDIATTTVTTATATMLD